MWRPGLGRQTQANFWGDLDRRVHVEWLAVTIALALFTLLTSYFSDDVGLTRLDHVFYDKTLAAATQRPALDDIVIVAIDDSSIARLGYWPWRRAVHAGLIRHLREAKAIGLDILFNDLNPAYPDDDRQLANTISTQGNVVLPLLLDDKTQSASLPLPSLARAAKSLGYINIYPDGDGVIRSVILHQELASGRQFNHFALAMLDAAGQHDRVAQLKRHPGTTATLIPYTGEPGHFQLYSYAAILNNQVPASTFKNKYVIVGSWSTGLGDSFPTPLAHQGETMSGVEILANILQSALTDQWIRTPGTWQGPLIAALPVLLICLLLRRLSPRHVFFAAFVALLLVFVADWLLLRYAHIWVAPTASLIGIALAGPVWSWRSQEVALQHIDRELLKLQEERPASGPNQPDPPMVQSDGSLPARVVKLHDAIAQVRQLRENERKAGKQREQTLRFLSHDMRSPQNSILALTELQHHPQTKLVQSELLRRIDQYARKTLTLVDGFVQLARAESMDIHDRPLDLVDLISETCDEYWVLAQQRNITLLFTPDVSLACVQGDQSVLGRAFGNLIDNAIKYSPDHTQVDCRLAEQAGYWEIRIQDEGRGITACGQATLFTPFIRLDENSPDNPGGSGLGLAFVKTVIERHSGTITVSSLPGQGTEFTIRLPISATLDS